MKWKCAAHEILQITSKSDSFNEAILLWGKTISCKTVEGAHIPGNN